MSIELIRRRLHRLLSPRSLKGKLLSWLIPGLLLTMVGTLWISSHYLRNQVDVAHDRSLAGALRAINLNTSTETGGLSVEQPFLLLEFFEMSVNGRVYFRVATLDGLAEIGSPAMPMPVGKIVEDRPYFYDATYLGESVRIAALVRQADPPILDDPDARIVVQVAEGLKSRDAFQASILRSSLERDAVGVAISILLIVAGVFVALRPLLRLREEMERREADDFSPIVAHDLPSEVRPLVSAVNGHMLRYTELAETQRQFLDDASHQLRTPLSVLRTQLAYALRDHDPDERKGALLAMQECLGRAERQTNQMLTLAKARDASINEALASQETIDVCKLLESIYASMMPVARAKRIDFGLDVEHWRSEWSTLFKGYEWLLREAITNLVDNALRYTPVQGRVTLGASSHAGQSEIFVEDNGPGMSPLDMSQAGIRFRRGQAGKHQHGAGLGLAIVKTITQIHGGEMHLENAQSQSPPSRDGLRVKLVFTLA